MTDKVYMAGPVDNVVDKGYNWRYKLQQEYPHIKWRDPLYKYNEHPSNLNIQFSDERFYDDRGVSSAWIVDNDKHSIRNCGVLLVNTDDVVSVGTPMEMLYANILDIPVVTCYQGDNLSPWMYHHSTLLFDELDNSVNAAKNIAEGGKY